VGQLEVPPALPITDVRFTPAGAGEVSSGLLGYLSLTMGDVLRLDGVVLRRTAAGRLALAFPARTARDGTRHPYMRPVDDAARVAIEAQVLGALSHGTPAR